MINSAVNNYTVFSIRRLGLLLTVTLLLSGCGSAPTQTDYYLLRSTTEVSDSTASSRELAASGVQLATVNVATYIDRPGLILADGESQVVAASYHQWAEPLRHSLMLLLTDEISAASGLDIHRGLKGLGDADQRIDVVIDQLHGDGKGGAILVASWSLTAQQKVSAGVKRYHFADSTKLSADGYPALVAAEQRLLKQLAEAIAASL